jgi:hypothetical protein
MDHTDLYISRIEEPYGKVYAQTVGRFQEGFLRDKVCTDLDDAFSRAVDCAERCLDVIKLKAS